MCPRLQNAEEHDNEVDDEYNAGDCDLDGEKNEVEDSSKGLLMTPITFHMTKFKHDTPVYDYDYDVNKILFSRLETPEKLPAANHFGGGAPRGALVKPSYSSSHTPVIKHCDTQDIKDLSGNNWVIPRVNDR